METTSVDPLDENYLKKFSIPDFWYGEAITLKNSYDVLAKIVRRGDETLARLLKKKLSSPRNDPDFKKAILDRGHYQACFMLVAYAFENLFKGTIVKDRARILKESEVKNLMTHNLLDLFSKAKIGDKLSKGDKNLFLRLQSYAEWAGRYPVESFKARNTKPLAYRRRDDLDRIEKLFKTVNAKIKYPS